MEQLRAENERLQSEIRRLRVQCPECARRKMLAMEGRTVHGGWPDVE